MKNEKQKKVIFIVIIVAVVVLIATVIGVTVFALKNNDKETNKPSDKENTVAVEKITTEESTTEEITTEESTTEEATTEELTQETTIEGPTTEEPTEEEPTTQEPTTEEPTTQESTTEEPTTQESTTEEPTTQEPTTEKPTTPPVVEEPMCFSVEDGVLYQYNSKKKEVVETGIDDWYELSPNAKAICYSYEGDNRDYIRVVGKAPIEIQLNGYCIMACLYDTGEAYVIGETKYDHPVQWCRTPIYYFDGSNIHIVTDRAPCGMVSAQPTTITATNTPILIFQQYVSNDSDVVNDYEIAIKGEVNYVDLKGAYDFTFTDNGNKMWYRVSNGDYVYDEEKNDFIFNGSNELYEIKIESNKISQPRLVDTGVSSVKAEFDPTVSTRGYVCLGDDLVYFKNAITLVDVEYRADGNHVKPIQTADMCVDGRLIDTDVVPNNAIYIGDIMYYFTDWNVEKECGTLTRYSNGDIKQLAVAIKSFNVLKNGDVEVVGLNGESSLINQ